MGTLPAAAIAPYGDPRQNAAHIVVGNPQFNTRGGRYDSPSEVEPAGMTLAPRPGDEPEAPHESALDLALDAALTAATLASGSRAVVGTVVGQRADQIRHASSVDRELVKAVCRQGAGASDGAIESAPDGRTAGWVGFRYGIGQGSS